MDSVNNSAFSQCRALPDKTSCGTQARTHTVVTKAYAHATTGSAIASSAVGIRRRSHRVYTLSHSRSARGRYGGTRPAVSRRVGESWSHQETVENARRGRCSGHHWCVCDHQQCGSYLQAAVLAAVSAGHRGSNEAPLAAPGGEPVSLTRSKRG